MSECAVPLYTLSLISSTGTLCCVQLSRYGEAIEWCDEGLKVDPDNQKLREVRTKAAKNKKKQERDERKQSAMDKKLKNQQDQLLSVIQVNNDLHVSYTV